MEGSVWTIPNVLSLLRLLTALPLAWALLAEATPWVVALGLWAVLSDVADGELARRQRRISEVGKALDPLADKIVAAVAALILAGQQKLPLWFVLLVLARDALLLLGGVLAWRWSGQILPSLPPGKWTALAIAGTLFAAYLGWEDWLAVGIALSILGIISSTGTYARRWWAVRQKGTVALEGKNS